MKRTRFSLVDRNCRTTVVLMPGWATDHRIFDPLDIPGNHLLPLEYSPFTFEKGLMEALAGNGIGKISLFGWSLGAFLAAEFAGRHPEMIDELFLISIRKRYRDTELKTVKAHIEKKKEGFLYKFYSQCFYDKNRFRSLAGFFKEYSRELTLSDLLESLEYLANAEVNTALLKSIPNITILHGAYDTVAPIEEASGVAKEVPHARFIPVENAGHMPFLEKEITGYIPWSTKD